ncbi:MAG: glycyl-radical enzyme activating protein [Candidatus Krumholzibacteriia bacterium]
MGRIFDIKRYSVHDGPGIRTTVFLQGCPLNCAWCHNPESRPTGPVPAFRAERCLACELCTAVCLAEPPAGPREPWPVSCERCGRCVTVCPTDARELSGRDVDARDLLDLLERDRLHFEQSGGGVTLSGGEPLAQPAFLLALLAGCRARGLHTAVDTTGHADAELVAAVAELADLWLFDLKHPDPARHAALTGVDNALILRNLALVRRRGAEVWLRVPVVPGLTDQPAVLAETGRLARGLGIARIHLLPYHAAAAAKRGRFRLDAAGLDLRPPTDDHLQGLAGPLRDLGLDVHLGG